MSSGMSFQLFSIPPVCEGAKLVRIGEDQFLKRNPNFNTPYGFYRNPKVDFQGKIAWISEKFHFLGKFG